uniref:ComEC/Rec2-related protein domain-containing protein n=1 Tax=Chromera velia CCMP2878 TaxID=1169474 RepID=A0A0G4HCJ2_9ALVE|eukprot:Cvel_6321.t1-p1 / transcript=Cvel_6321.t1 / gene=Cvel_6321 / organism=Chromera_velia_CCMP2878 / gene_product=hypothetical protein / transcript_product=hypothetical protein / location=Cvel_scaffold307:2125-2629(+) / protein_length=116 / sequence_SO=supercontig / SO=protein_coding / is_pseudo=false
MAYHTALMNRLCHWIFIPFQLAAIAKALTLIPVPVVGDAALFLILGLSILYVLCEPLSGLFFTLVLLCLRALGMALLPSGVAGLLLELVVIVAGYRPSLAAELRRWEKVEVDTWKK